MKLAVMQPYLFPYLGYFQLIHAVDLFVIYDDVAFIKQGYINRNSILSRGQPLRFTLPVPGASSNRKICELHYAEDAGKLLKTVAQSYARAPHVDRVLPIITEVLESRSRGIAELCLLSYRRIFDYLGLSPDFVISSTLDYDRSLPAEQRLIHLCRKFGADIYINAAGGAALYSRRAFADEGITLGFLQPDLEPYPQPATPFVPGLSIIDVLMNVPPDRVRALLTRYRLE